MHRTPTVALTFVCLFGFVQCLLAQDAEFSQYLFNPVYLNPAMAGINNGPRFVLNYRNQWPAMAHAFNTFSVSYDQHIDAISGGLGFQVLSDQQADGVYKKTGLSAMYNYQFKVSEHTAVRAGFSGSVFQNRLAWDKLLFGDEFDPSTAVPVNTTGETVPDLPNRTYFDAGAGLVIYGKKAYAGLAARHITQPNLSVYRTGHAPLPLRIAINFGAEIRTKRHGKTYISPNLMLVHQASFQQIQGHLLVYRGPLILGLGLRRGDANTDALIFYAGVHTGVLKVVYSYDSTYSNLRGKSGGAHEISIAVNMSESKKAAKKRSIKNSVQCPNML